MSSRQRPRRAVTRRHHRAADGYLRTIAATLLAVLLGACVSSPQSPVPSSAPTILSSAPPSPAALASATPTPRITPTPAPTAGPTGASSCPVRTLTTLTEAQRIGQLFAVGLAGDEVTATTRDAIARFHFGSWWFVRKTSAGVDAIRAVSDAVQAQASDAATGGIGFFIAANQEGGRIQALAGPGFAAIPSALTQGTWSTRDLRSRAAEWGRQLLAAGVNLDFAPVADVVPPGMADRNAPIGALEREYGSEPAVVADHVMAFIEGMADAGVVTTAKHFPGLGRVAENTDFATGVVDTETTADDPDLEPFRRAVEAGVPAVMVSLATYERIDPRRIAAFSWPTIGGILEDDLGFGGIVMSDSLSAEAVSSIPAGTRALRFLDNGGDLIVIRSTGVAITMAKALAARARQSSWLRRRIDNAVLHVLRAKAAAGLLPCGG